MLLVIAALLSLAACAEKPADPESYQPHLDKGKEALAAGDYETAVKETSNAIAAKPEAEAYTVRGEAHAAKGDHNAAANDFYEALDRNQESPQTWCALGVSDTARGEYGAAAAAFGKALRLDANYAPAYYGRAMLNKAQEKKDDAVADLRRVLEKSQDEKLRAAARAALRELGEKEF